MGKSNTIWRSLILWICAVLITLASAVYQRVTGPTHPATGAMEIGDVVVQYDLPRNHGGVGGQEVVIESSDSLLQANLVFRRYKTSDSFSQQPMSREASTYKGILPHQPPAGKLEYYIELNSGGETATIPADRTVVIRFKGGVPLLALIPHVILMFLAMLFSARTGLEACYRDGRTWKLTMVTIVLLGLGGLIFGPVVQKYAFGAFWTGVPFGWDLTDNKTLIAFVGWLLVVIQHCRGKETRYWVLAAALLLLVIFLIPHSMMGSELDYKTGAVETG